MIHLKLTKKALTQKFTYLFLLTLLPLTSLGQEFICDVSIDDKNLEGTSFEYVKQNLEDKLENYINEYRWTEVEFKQEERISCQINIILTSGDDDFNFSAETILTARRPIYNSLTETSTLIVGDQAWQFSYPQGKSLIHDDLEFENLTGFIDFYMYLFLGFDFDSFSELGGDTYFAKAQDVVDLAQNLQSPGWNRNGNNQRNRFVLISDLLNNNYQPLRKAIYSYHRLGLDTFIQSPDGAREAVLNTLTEIQAAKRRSTSNYLYDLFFDTKSREITSIFRDADSRIKLQAYNILRETDSGHLTEYEELQN